VSDVTPEAPAPVETPEPSPAPEKLSPRGKAAMQGQDLGGAADVQDAAPPSNTLNASSFKPETKAALAANGLDDADATLADNQGHRAEETARIVLKHEGLPQGQTTVPLKEVVPGQHTGRHGIDLVGVTADGQPVPIEVKKRADPAQDSVGKDSAELCPKTLKLKEQMSTEEAKLAALNLKGGTSAEGAAQGAPDPEHSNEQMAGLWTRDGWLRLVDDPARSAALQKAGVDAQYFDQANLENPYSPQWNDILRNRATVIVSGDKDNVTDKLMREAVFKRGFDVSVINLKK